MYDIFLQRGCSVRPDLGHVIEQIPALTDAILQERIVQLELEPGFLGLDLPAPLALMLFECLVVAGARGYRVSSTYRYPHLTTEKATVYATQALTQQWEEQFAETSFSLLPDIIDRGVCWEFVAREAHRQVTVYIDKLDGHLWSREDIQHLSDESTIIRRKVKYAEAYTAGLPMTRWPERYEIYDIVISGACRTQPHIQDLTQVIPGLENELLQARFVVNGMMTKEQYIQWADLPFLELNLPYDLAKTLALRLQESGAWANYIPTVYRKPQFPFSKAQVLAEQIIMEMHESVIPHEPLGLVGLHKWLWTPYWIFSTPSRAAPPEPGHLFAHIDKIDGHIWTHDEKYLFIREGKLN